MASRNLPISGRQWPMSPIMELHRDLDRLFGGMLGGWDSGNASSFAAMPQLEVCEQGSDLCVSVELPGVRQEDVDVRLAGDTLLISGEKKSSNAQQEGSMHVSERSYGRFQRQVTLPFTPDPERTQASLENGVLTIRLGRMPEGSGSRRIEVRGGGQGASSPALQSQGSQASSMSGMAGTMNEPGGAGMAGGAGGAGAGSGAGSAGAASAAGSTGGVGSEDGGQTPP